MTLALHLPQVPDSWLTRFEPRWKLLGTLLLLAVTASLQCLPTVGVILLLTLALVPLGRVPWLWYRNRLALLWPLLLGVVVLLPLLLNNGGPAVKVGPMRLSWHGLAAGLRISGKALAIVTLVLILLATTPLPRLLQAGTGLRLPGPLLSLLALTYRYLLLLLEELQRIRIALRTRGFRNRADLHSYRTIGHLTGLLLVRSAERGERVNQALRTRGFDGRYRCLEVSRSRWSDVGLFLLLCGAAMGLVLWDRLFLG